MAVDPKQIIEVGQTTDELAGRQARIDLQTLLLQMAVDSRPIERMRLAERAQGSTGRKIAIDVLGCRLGWTGHGNLTVVSGKRSQGP
ncbi:hypothetical protein D3C85_1827780 [compost metagenome]